VKDFDSVLTLKSVSLWHELANWNSPTGKQTLGKSLGVLWMDVRFLR